VIFFALLFLTFIIPVLCNAQAADKHGSGDKGKTYYDVAKTMITRQMQTASGKKTKKRLYKNKKIMRPE